MADVKLSALPPGSAVVDGDLFYSAPVAGGQVKQLASALKSYVLASVTGGGNVSNSGTPTVNQYARWVTATTIQGVAPATVLSDIGAQPAGSYQPLDSTLTAFAAYNTNGLLTQTAADTFTGRTLTGPAAGITVNNGSGVAGNPTLVLANDLAALEALGGTNTIYYRSGADTWTAVTVSTGLTFSGGTLSASAGGTPRTQTRFTAGATLATEQIVNSNCAAPATFVLPLANTRAGQPLTIKDVGGQAFTNNITINRSGADLIDGQTSYLLANNYAGVTFMPANDGTSTGWYVT